MLALPVTVRPTAMKPVVLSSEPAPGVSESYTTSPPKVSTPVAS